MTLSITINGTRLDFPDVQLSEYAPGKVQSFELDAHLIEVGDVFTAGDRRFRVVEVREYPLPCGVVDLLEEPR